jgi:hypothetical protein
MFPIQPVGWSNYLTFSSTISNQSFTHYFYLSWEDALWDLLKYFSYPKGSVVLIPDFYCADVVKNMKEHGLKCVTYPVDRNFQTSVKFFKQAINKTQPQIVIIFHSVGITNKLINQFNDWQAVLPKDCLLLEDSVHRLVEPNKLKLLADRHVVIDSLRKVIPIQGSNLYGTEVIKNLEQTKIFSTFFYRFMVVFWWFIFQACLNLSKIFPVKSWQIYWSLLAEKVMLIGYEIIGDSQFSGHGLSFFKFLSRHIDFEKIAKAKIKQVNKYETLLVSIWQSPKVFKIEVDQNDYGNLRAFPVGLNLDTAPEILKKLRAKGLLVRFELDNFGWTKKQKVIYLPLGPHLNDKDIEVVAEILIQVVNDLT